MENEIISENINYCFEDIFALEDLESRRIYITGQIDNIMANAVMHYILRYNRADFNIDIKDRRPIIIYLNSNGGSASAGFGIVDVMLSSKTPVYTVNLGECYSMALLIFIAGQKRYSMPSSTFLNHDGASYAGDSVAKLKDRMDFEFNQVERHIKNYVVSRTEITDRQHDKNYRKEWYFYPTEAKELGVVTHIIGTDCDLDEIL